MVLRYDNKCASDLLPMEWIIRVTFLIEKSGIFRSSTLITATGFAKPLPRLRQLKCEGDHCALPGVTLFFTFIPFLVT
jgi:hypothetical protein